jgi:hypothetical protein
MIGVTMDTVQTYQGYFLEDGRFVTSGVKSKLPIRRRAIVNVFVEEVAKDSEAATNTNSFLSDRIQRIALLLADAANAENDVMTDDDWDEMLTLRSQTNSGLSRAVEI